MVLFQFRDDNNDENDDTMYDDPNDNDDDGAHDDDDVDMLNNDEDSFNYNSSSSNSNNDDLSSKSSSSCSRSRSIGSSKEDGEITENNQDNDEKNEREETMYDDHPDWDNEFCHHSHHYNSSSDNDDGNDEIDEDEHEYHNHDGNEDSYDGETEQPRQSFASYFLPSFIKHIFGRRRKRRVSQSPSRSTSRDWDREEEEDQEQERQQQQDGEAYEEENRDGHREREEGKEEFRLIASTQYERNYDQDDFYHRANTTTNYDLSYYNNNTNSDETSNSNHDDRSYENHTGVSSSSLQRHNSRTLVSTSSTAHTGNPNNTNEVHYHIYVSESQATRWFSSNGNNTIDNGEQEQQDTTRRRGESRKRKRRSLWKVITVLAIITQCVYWLVRRYDTNHKLMNKYGPLLLVLPPPPYLTWTEYSNQQSRLVRKLSKEGCILLKHVFRQTITTVSFSRLLNNYDNQNEDKNDKILSSNLFVFPSDWSSLGIVYAGKTNSRTSTATTPISSSLLQPVVLYGQDVALERLRTELNNHRGHGPRVVYVTGGKSIGKRALAYLILNHLRRQEYLDDVNYQKYQHDDETTTTMTALEECSSSILKKNGTSSITYNDDSDSVLRNQYHSGGIGASKSRYCPLLRLTPFDYYHNNFDVTNDDIDNDEAFSLSFSSRLYQRILDHVVAAGGGASIVLFERVDCVSSSSSRGEYDYDDYDDSNYDPPKYDDVNNCQQDQGQKPESQWLYDLMKEIRSSQGQSSSSDVFESTMFVMTSSVGTTTMEKWTRKRLQQQNQLQQQQDQNLLSLPPAPKLTSEIESLLRYDIRRYHGSGNDRIGGDEKTIGINNDSDRDDNNQNRTGNGDGDDETSHNNKRLEKDRIENNDDNIVVDDMGINDWIILPMTPLNRNAMKAVLGTIASRTTTIRLDRTPAMPGVAADLDSNLDTMTPPVSALSLSFVLSESASNRILDGIEWHQWMHKSSKDVLRIWSPDGIRPLLRLWNDEILATNIFQQPHDDMHHQCLDAIIQHFSSLYRKQQQKLHPHQQRQLLLLDYDENTTGQFVVHSCMEVQRVSSSEEVTMDTNNNNQEMKDVFIVSAIDHQQWDCRPNDFNSDVINRNIDICRFYL